MGKRRKRFGGKAISNRLAVFGAPDILVVGKDKRFTGEIFQDFCTARNITLQTVIPGHHQSLGATERRHAHFRGIIDHIIGNRKSNCLSHKEWGEFSDTAALHLNSEVRQYDGFTPGRRVLGRAPKWPIGTVGNRNFTDPMKPIAAPTTKSLSLVNTISKYESVFIIGF